MPARPLLRLTLVRHAKTEPGRPGQEDWDRVLETRGQRDAPEMARRLKQISPKPDRILSSPAVRAITTRNTRHDSDLYAGKLAEKLRQVTEEFLVHENRDRSEFLESVLAPALAPGEHHEPPRGILDPGSRRGYAATDARPVSFAATMLSISTSSSQNSRASSRAASVA